MDSSIMSSSALDGASSGDASPRAEIACLVCRSRKVRCDRTLPACKACARLGVTCPRYDLDSEFISRKEIQKSTEDIFKAAGVEKRRVGSCKECRSSKHRCTQTRPSCRRCLLRGLPCTYPDKQDRAKSLPAGSRVVPIDAQRQQKKPRIDSGFGVDVEKLCSDTLPEDPDLRLRLINSYFDRTHHLRCLSFIHKPSFMQSLERASVIQDYGEPLLYMMCAQGARYIHSDEQASSDNALSTGTPRIPGRAWAERARKDVLDEMHAPTTHHLMTMVLYSDYGLREDQNAAVLITMAYLHRVIILLGLDVPRPLGDSASPAETVQRETENRLVWACYFIDRLLETGVPKNSLWRDIVPGVPLPCPDYNFEMSIPSQPRFVQDVEDGDPSQLQDLDFPALSLVILRLRCRVLRAIRTHEMRVWEPESEFLQILQSLDLIYQNLPAKYHLTQENIQVFKEKRILGAGIFLHLFIQAAFFDLTRISLPGFDFPLAAAFRDAPAEFQSQCQDRCRYHASQMSELIRRGMEYGRSSFDDILCADAALEAGKIQLVYAATVDQSPQIVHATRENLYTILEFLGTSNRSRETSHQFVRTLLPLCTLFGFRDIADRYKEHHGVVSELAEVTGSAEANHMSTFAPFRRAQSELQGTQSANSPKALSSVSTQPSSHLTHASQRPSSRVPESPLSGEFVQQVPIPRPPHNPMDAAPPSPSNAMAPRNPLQLMPSAGVMVQNGAILQPSVDDYIKTAQEMSSYLTWNMPNMPDLPPWMSIG